jgi:hypothetical protein
MLRTRRTSLARTVLVGMVLLPAAAWAQAKVVVVDNVQSSLKLKLGVRQAVATALDDLSVAMVPLEDVIPEDASCAAAACYAAIAKRVEATHVLLVQGVANPAGYRLTLEVRDGTNGRTLGTDGKDCELCAESQLAPTVQEKVTALWIRVMQEQSAPPAPPPTPRPAAVVAPPAQAPGVDTSAVSPWWQQRTPLMGLGFGVAGLVAAGFGVYYITQDGKRAETNNVNGSPILRRDTGKWGWSLTGVGVVALLAGSAMVIWGGDDGSNASVAVGPQSVVLQGRF